MRLDQWYNDGMQNSDHVRFFVLVSFLPSKGKILYLNS